MNFNFHRPRVGEEDELQFQFTELLKLEREVDFRQHKSNKKDKVKNIIKKMCKVRAFWKSLTLVSLKLKLLRW